MASTIVTKNSSTASAVPVTGDLTQGELAVNVTDKKLYTKDSGGTVVKLVGGLGNQEANAVAITGGSINGTTVGATTASTGAFTTLTASSTTTLSGGTANGVAYLNGSKVVTTGSALTFDGTNLNVGNGSVTTTNNFFTATTSGYFFAGAGGFAGGVYGSNSGNYANIKAPTDIVSIIGSTEQMRLTSTGLGIGTSSPSVKLHAKSASNEVAYFESTSASNYSYIFLKSLTGNGTYLGADGNGSFVVQTPGGAYSTKLTVDSVGNLGLGVTPSAWDSTWKAVQLQYGAFATDGNTGYVEILNNSFASGASTFKRINGLASTRYSQRLGAHAWYYAGSGTAGDPITFTQAMTLDASGNLGLGTTSPKANSGYATLTLNNATNGGVVQFTQADTTIGQLFFDGNGGTLRTSGSTSLVFGTANTERARIDTSGNLLVGTTSGGVYNGILGRLEVVTTTTNYTAATFKNATAGQQTVSIWNATDSGTRYFVEFSDGSTRATRGSITSNGTTTAYNTTSDYRLKEDVAPMTGALAKVAALKPVTYKWKVDGSDGEGFIAHELQAVVPQCVTGEKDAVDAEGNPVYQGIDTSFLVATLTAALQEMKAIIDDQAARIAALETK